uniref:MTOR-associated protein MEAK7 n=1 Tax=Bos mutus grunniens TaxID=30521 RepID=A0A8B9XT32_BOSMU
MPQPKDKDWLNGYKNKTPYMLSTRDPPQNRGHIQLLTVSPRAGRGQQAVRCSVVGEAWLQCLAQILLSAGTEGPCGGRSSPRDGHQTVRGHAEGGWQREGEGAQRAASQEQFTASMSHLLKGTAEEKSLVILNMISASGGPVKARDVHKFTEDLVGSVVHVLSYRRQLRGWSQKPPPGSPSRVQVLAAQLCSEMRLQGGGKLLGPQWLDRDCDQAVLEDWVFRAHHVAMFLSLVIHQGFLLLRSSLKLATLVPERQVDPQREFASVLDVLSVIYVNSHLPQERRLSWRLLFATELHGNSFAQLCGRIAHGGPCLVLLEDSDGHVFGGFASCSWEVKPQFQGDDRCFLFSVSPRMAVYTCTGYNDHYMYLNQGQQTIPNGLGMGGQHGYFGLWIDVDFGKGHSKAKPTCTTYGSPQLSAQEDFQFQKMEVWAVGEAPKAESVSLGRFSPLSV